MLRIRWLTAVLVSVILAVVACGVEEPTEILREPTRVPLTGLSLSALSEIAAERANGPGAIYIGDLNQLVGPAPTKEQGDLDGNVKLDAVRHHSWIYDSEYYQKLLEKANIQDPTDLVSRGESITIRHICVEPGLLTCELMRSFFAPTLWKRTNGQTRLAVETRTFWNHAGSVSRGPFMASIYGEEISRWTPELDIASLWSIYPDQKTAFTAAAQLVPVLEKLASEVTGDGVVVNHNWSTGNHYFISNNVINSKLWDNLNPDLQQILIEEGAKSELEALRLWSVQNEGALAQNLAASKEIAENSQMLKDLSRTEAIEQVIPQWIKKVGGPEEPIIATFNEVVGPLVGVRINPDGTVVNIE